MAKGDWQCQSRYKEGIKTVWAVRTRQFWSHVSNYSQSKMVSWDDAYFLCRLVIWEIKSSVRLL